MIDRTSKPKLSELEFDLIAKLAEQPETSIVDGDICLRKRVDVFTLAEQVVVIAGTEGRPYRGTLSEAANRLVASICSKGLIARWEDCAAVGGPVEAEPVLGEALYRIFPVVDFEVEEEAVIVNVEESDKRRAGGAQRGKLTSEDLKRIYVALLTKANPEGLIGKNLSRLWSDLSIELGIPVGRVCHGTDILRKKSVLVNKGGRHSAAVWHIKTDADGRQLRLPAGKTKKPKRMKEQDQVRITEDMTASSESLDQIARREIVRLEDELRKDEEQILALQEGLKQKEARLKRLSEEIKNLAKPMEELRKLLQ